MTLQLSRRLALAAGIVLPVLTTARRWRELGDPVLWLVWLDDWAIAGFLIYGAWRAGRDPVEGRKVLAGAWGFACGLGYASFAFSVVTITAAEPSGLSRGAIVTVKGLLLLLGIAGLAGALRTQPPARSDRAGRLRVR